MDRRPLSGRALNGTPRWWPDRYRLVARISPRSSAFAGGGFASVSFAHGFTS